MRVYGKQNTNIHTKIQTHTQIAQRKSKKKISIVYVYGSIRKSTKPEKKIRRRKKISV